MKRGFAVSVFVLVIVVSTAGTASAQQQNSVSVSGTTSMGVVEQCFTEPTTTPGSVTFTRTSTEGPFTITYHISGGPTDLNSDAVAGADHTVDFADNEATATVVVHPTFDATDATVTVVAGQGYVVGDPASGTINVTRQNNRTCPTETTVATRSTLARTGARSTSGPLAIVGITAIALGSLLLVLSSRRKMSGVR
jgi:hypothetical protein